MSHLHRTLLATVAALAAGTVQAASISVDHTDFDTAIAANSSTATVVEGGLTLTWKADALVGGTAQDRLFQKKDSPMPTGPALKGVGVSGATAGEIDRQERLTATAGAGQSFRIQELVLGLLFDGHEFGDVQEQAQVVAHLVNGGTLTGVLTNTYQRPPAMGADNDLTWDKAVWMVTNGTTVLSVEPKNLSPSTQARGAVWSLTNPFGSYEITKLEFTALKGTAADIPECKSKNTVTCTNQSDYTFISMKAQVPEPATLGLLGLGLLGAAAARRRRVA